MEDGEIRGAIVDAQGRLNINALGAADASAEQERARLARLFAQRGMPPVALAAMADWIDADGAAGEAGAEDAFYLAEPMPRLAANAPVLRVAELGVVKGVTPQMLAAVLPFLSALPAGTPVNVNTAPREVLAAIVGKSGAESLDALVADRTRKPFTTIAEFRARLPDGAALASDVALSVKSNYFYVTIEARQGATRSHARALLRRGGGGGDGVKPAIVWQVVE
jgi:general secretion pathway protein K